MKDTAGWLAAGALVVGALAVGLSPIIAVTGIAILMDVPLRIDPALAMLTSFGIAVAWLIAVSILEVPLKIALRNASHLQRQITINAASLLLLSVGYSIIIDEYLASLIMAGLSFASYLALRPLIERADRAADALPRDLS